MFHGSRLIVLSLIVGLMGGAGVTGCIPELAAPRRPRVPPGVIVIDDPLPQQSPPPNGTHPERPPEARFPSRPGIQWEVLPSGLLVLLESDMYATAAGVVSVVAGGASTDPAGAEGLAHLVEHLTYRAHDSAGVTPLPLGSGRAATARQESRSEKLLHYAASATNALTGPDGITFFEFGPPTRLRWMLEIEGARLTDPLAGVDEKSFALERQVVGTEHALRDDPRAAAWAASALFPTLFPAKHPYARTIGGTEASLARLTLADARGFVTASFRPERMTLLVTAPTGQTSLNGIIAALPKALVGDAKHPVARPAPAASTAAIDATPPGPILRRNSRLPAAQLWLGWTLPGSFGASAGTELLLQHWVEEDLDLDQLRQEDPKIRHVTSMLQSGRQASVLYVRALLADGADADRAAQIIGGRVASLWARESSEQEMLTRIKNRIATEFALGEPSQLPRAIEATMAAAYSPAPPSPGEVEGAAFETKTSDLAKFAYTHLTRERMHAMMFSPAPPGPARAAGPGSRRAAEPLADTITAAAQWDLMELPGTRGPVRDVVVKTLPNGLTLIVAHRQARAALAWLGFHGGYTDADPPLLVELALRVRPDLNDAPKWRMLPGRGATRDATIETIEFFPSRLHDALPLLFAKATVPVRDWPDRDKLERMLAPLTGSRDPSADKADQAFVRALFGDHAYARLVNAADLPRVARADVDGWVGRVHNIRNAALVVVGDVNATEVEREAIQATRELNARAWVAPIAPPTAPALRPASETRLTPVVTAAPGGLTEIRLGCLLPRATVADRGHHDLLQLAIQERLNAALRLERGEGYGVSVGYERLRGGTTSLAAVTYVDTEELADSLATIRGHWQRWSRAGFDAGELNLARWRYASQLPLAQSTNQGIAYQLFDEWSLAPAAVTAQLLRPDVVGLRDSRVSELFATCKANAVLGLTGNEPAIHRALRTAWPELAGR
jgi:zinc protease